MLGLVGGSIQRNCGGHVSCRAGFKSDAVKPLSERIFGRSLGRFKRFVAGAALGAMLATGSGASFAGCGQDNARVEDSVKDEVKIIVANTNENGTAIFELSNSERVSLRVVDGGSGEPIKDLLVKLASKGDSHMYFITDSLKRYQPTFATGKPRQMKSSTSTNIVDETQIYPCTGMGTDIASQVLVPQSLVNDTRLLTDLHFVKDTQLVKLSELDNFFHELIQMLAEEGIFHLGYEIAGGIVLTPIQFCSMGERMRFADYYRSLCYPEDAEFNVWMLGGVNLEPAVSNPVIVVLPVAAREGESAWVAPTATIQGTTMWEDGTVVNDAHVELRNVQGIFNKTESESDSNGHYTYIASACPTANSYTLKADKLTGAASVVHGDVEAFTVSKGQVITKNIQMHQYTLGDDFDLPIDDVCYWLIDSVESKCPDHNYYYPDSDSDAYGNSQAVAQRYCVRPPFFVTDNHDCNDMNRAVNPGHSEDCDGIDNNCDGIIDRITRAVRCEGGQRTDTCERGSWVQGECTPPPCTNSTYYQDNDGDGLGNPNVSRVFCSEREASDSGYVSNSEDCNDSSRAVGRYVNRQVVPCNRGTGWSVASCSRGVWAPGDCLPLLSGGGSSGSSEEEPACVEREERGVECTVEGRVGVRVDSCVSGAWVEGTCEALAECAEGEEREVTCTYAVGYEGVRTDSCVGGWWQAGWCHGTECTGTVEVTTSCTADGLPGVSITSCWNGWLVEEACRAFECSEGEERSVSCTVSPGVAGTRVVVCVDGWWSAGSCTPLPECADGETRSSECVDAAGRVGSKVDVCVSGFFAEGECTGSECVESERRTATCGYGTRVDSCTLGWWVESTCPPEPTCVPLPITLSSSSWGSMAAGGSWAAGILPDRNAIKYVNLSTFSAEPLVSTEYADGLHIEGNAIYFLKGASESFNRRLMRFEIGGGLTELEDSEGEPIRDYPVSVSGDKIVLLVDNGIWSPPSYSVYTTTDGSVIPLTACGHETLQMHNASIYGGIVVAQETDYVSSMNSVFAYDFAGGSCWLITSEANQNICPVIYSSRVAYLKQSPDSGYNVYLTSSAGGDGAKISPTWQYVDSQYLSMNESKIAYMAYIHPAGTSEGPHVFVYDIYSGATSDYGVGSMPELAESGVVFYRASDESSTITFCYY